MEFIDKIYNYCLVGSPEAFMTALILSGVDFTNLKQYSLSKWFQLSQMAVNRSSLVDGAFSWTIW